jgi:sulfur-carrier protein adenylyltransferase/sulfurtransferase
MSVTVEEIFSRQMALPEIGVEGQRRLQQSSLLIAGLGGLGCAALSYLAASGIGRIGLLDFDRVEPSNLPRQILYGEKDLGKYKALAAYERLQAQYPQTAFDPLPIFIEQADLSSYDFIVDATDNSAARYAINDRCSDLKKPWIYGSIDHWQGQAALFIPGSFNYRALFPDASGSPAASCAAGAVLGPMAGVIGSIQAIEAIIYVATFSSDLANKLLLLNAKEWSMRLFHFAQEQSWAISPKELAFLIEDEDACLIDATQPFSAAELPKNRKIVFCCPEGMRSRAAAERLRQEGYEAYFVSREGFLNF